MSCQTIQILKTTTKNGPGLFLECLAVISACILVSGCGQTETMPQPAAAASVLLEMPGDPVWQACQNELKRRGYVLDYVDRQSGVIQTYPLASKQWFEFWRDDLGGSEALLESSLQTQRRMVYLHIQPEEGPRCRLECKVDIEKRVYAPENCQGTVRGEDIFGASPGRSVLRGFSDTDSKQPYQWVPAGRDSQLEKRIIDSIQKVL